MKQNDIPMMREGAVEHVFGDTARLREVPAQGVEPGGEALRDELGRILDELEAALAAA